MCPVALAGTAMACPIENEIEKAKDFQERLRSKRLALPILMKSAAASFFAILKSGK